MQKRNRPSSSSTSESDSPDTKSGRRKSDERKPVAKNARTDMEQESIEENFSMQDLGQLLISFKTETRNALDTLNSSFTSFRFELQHEMKEVKEEVSEFRLSMNGAWTAIEALQKEMVDQKTTIKTLSNSVDTLQTQLEIERQRRIQLDRYSRKENLRLIGVKEQDGEDCENVVRRILTEMGVLRDGVGFHAVHRVGPQIRPAHAKGNGRQIIMRFLNRQDREHVWRNRGEIKKTSGGRIMLSCSRSSQRGSR